MIVLDTLEKCLSSQAAEAPKYDDVMNVKLLLKEICQYLDLHDSSSNQARTKRATSAVSTFTLPSFFLSFRSPRSATWRPRCCSP